MDARRIDASGSAEPMSGLNPDVMDGEGTAFAKRRQLPRRKSQMASRGMEEEKAELMLCVRDVIQIAHQCTMQEREKQPASDAGKKKKEIVTTCSRD